MQKGLRHPRVSAGRQEGISLVELLVAMSILAVVTSMILMSWFALQKSFAQTSRASQSRESARDAVARMTQEIRDAQGSNQGSAITEAERTWIVFYSTYNMTENATTNSAPRQTAFVYQWSTATRVGKIYRVVDLDVPRDGVSDELDDPAAYGRLVVDNVVNWNTPTAAGTSVFRYSYYASGGAYSTVDSVPADSIATIRNVRIRVLVDLNPGKSPVYMDLQTTAQPRNMRPAT